MSPAGPDEVALFVRCHRDELTRIWRMARRTACTEVFPGLIDDLVESFLDACSDRLAHGKDPEAVWGALRGVLRWAPAVGPDELHREWALLGEVAAAASDSIEGEEAVRSWLRRAAHHCRDGMAALDRDPGGPPPGVLRAVVYSSLAPRRTQGEEHGSDA